jgi:hypothetical protein
VSTRVEEECRDENASGRSAPGAVGVGRLTGQRAKVPGSRRDVDVFNEGRDRRSRQRPVEISGQPGQYAGKIVTAEGREVKIVDILTGPKSIVIVAELPEGGAAVIRGLLDASGKLTGTWGPVRPAIPVTLERKQ